MTAHGDHIRPVPPGDALGSRPDGRLPPSGASGDRPDDPASPYDVVVVGSVNADLIVRVDRRPAPGETVFGGDLAVHPGGKGANQAVAAARLGARVALLGRVGSDANGEFLRRALSGDGVDLGHLLETPGPSGVALITVGPDGDNSIIVSPAANGRLSEDDVAAAAGLLDRARIVSLQLETPLATVLAAARAAARVVFNLSPPAPVPGELLARCDPLVVNEHEAEFLLGERGAPDRQARALLALGPRSVVVTLGADGAVVAEPGAVTAVPSPRVAPVDTTGAGDAFTGALTWRLSRGDDLVTATEFAVRVGAASVRKPGAQGSYPYLEELKVL